MGLLPGPGTQELPHAGSAKKQKKKKKKGKGGVAFLNVHNGKIKEKTPFL